MFLYDSDKKRAINLDYVTNFVSLDKENWKTKEIEYFICFDLASLNYNATLDHLDEVSLCMKFECEDARDTGIYDICVALKERNNMFYVK